MLMAWLPPTDWHELSGDQRHAYLEQHGIRLPLRPADWDTLELKYARDLGHSMVMPRGCVDAVAWSRLG